MNEPIDPTGNPLEIIARISRSRPVATPGSRCEMCGEPIAEEHSHIVNVEQRSLLCACRPCYLLFTAPDAALKYRAVPDRHLAFDSFRFGARQWDELEIPVGLVFVFVNSALGRIAAFYPGPAGATESTLPLAAWDRVVEDNPGLRTLRPDVEALLLRAPTAAEEPYECFLVPVDRCYELIGRLRQVWRGFDGGQQAREQLAGFFADLRRRSRGAPATENTGQRVST